MLALSRPLKYREVYTILKYFFMSGIEFPIIVLFTSLYLILGDVYSPVSEASREVANLTERKKLHTPLTIKFSFKGIFKLCFQAEFKFLALK